jgi:hypothetical protein
LKQPHIDELCRRCRKKLETIQHITTTCKQLAPTEYVKRHDGLAKDIHQKLAGAAELTEDKSPFYKYTPANVLVNDKFKLFLISNFRRVQYVVCFLLDNLPSNWLSYFPAKPSLISIPQLFSNLVIINLLA